MLHGFVMIVIDGQEKVLRVDEAFTPDRLGVATLDYLRRWAPPAVDQARKLRLVDISTGTDSDWHAVRRAKERLAERPEEFVQQTLAVGVGFNGAWDVSLTQSRDVLWGYVIDLDRWGFEVYEGWQQSPHTDGRFWERATSRTSYPPRLVAVFPMVDASAAGSVLPSREEFLRQVREGARTLECSWPA
ncbi:hypothetical protein [Micromonospora sp. NPDC005652]|uniref:hypothetical protein n=1 Tax=Micromonospora sp. NPDC005652 TaxID=3157046 RepID=UPI0033DE1210